MSEFTSLFWLTAVISILIYNNKQRQLDRKKIADLKIELEILRTKNKSYELTDFLSDIKTHGYSVLRINPDSVFFRGKR